MLKIFNMVSTFRNIFFTGLLVFIPISATIFIIYWTFTYIDNLVKPLVLKTLGFYYPGMSWLFLISIILILGVIGRFAIGNRLVDSVENMMKKIPVVRTIYTATKEASKAILVSETERIKGVVLIEYPRKGIYAIGFTTGSDIRESNKTVGKKTMNVFIPTSPNPTSGYVILVPEEDVKYLDITVEDALKIIISGGFIKS